jgi:hypothetical protein
MNKIKFADARRVRDVFRYKIPKKRYIEEVNNFGLRKCAKNIILNLIVLMLKLKELINVAKDVRSSRKY